MKCSYEGHSGTYCPDDESVNFYGIRFSYIQQAVKFLRNLAPSNTYHPWCRGSIVGLKDTEDGMIYVDGTWVDNEESVLALLKFCKDNQSNEDFRQRSNSIRRVKSGELGPN